VELKKTKGGCAPEVELYKAMDDEMKREEMERKKHQAWLAGLSSEDREAYMEQQKSASRHAEQKDSMLKSQLGVYGKKKGIVGRRGKSKKEPQPETEPVVDAEAEKRRRSRAKKIEALREEEERKDREKELEKESLMSKLDSRKSARNSTRHSSKRRSTRFASVVEVFNKPMSLSVWIFAVFSLVSLDRLIKYISMHANPVYVSKGLGAVLILASFGVKVPQIMSILEAKNVNGLSLAKFYTGVLSATLVVAYHVANRNPFTAWGDSLSVLIQDAIIVVLIWQFGKTNIAIQAGASGAFVAIVAGLAMFCKKQRPQDLWYLPLLSTVIAHSGTIPQIIEISKNKHTGALSFVTQLMLTLGSLARVFTTLSEIPDPVVLLSFVSSVLVQGFLLVQIIMYWSNTNQILAKPKRKSRVE